jgi:hypothetical protein
MLPVVFCSKTSSTMQTSHTIRAGEIDSSGSRVSQREGASQIRHTRDQGDSQDVFAIRRRQDCTDSVDSRAQGALRHEVSTWTVRAKDQTYQVFELYEIMNVESVFGGLCSEGAPSRAGQQAHAALDAMIGLAHAGARQSMR